MIDAEYIHSNAFALFPSVFDNGYIDIYKAETQVQDLTTSITKQFQAALFYIFQSQKYIRGKVYQAIAFTFC